MLKKLVCLLLSSVSLCASQGQFAKTHDAQIWYETFGNKKDPALLLIMGGCCQGVIWSKDFCHKLVQEGFYVIRYDHRDAGLSTCFDFEKQPYTLIDMAQDAISVLDAAGVAKAHLFGVSLGGMLAELMAVHYPQRVHTITVMSSTCELYPMNCTYAGIPIQQDTSFSPPSAHYLAWMKEFLTLSPATEEEKLEQRLEGWRRLNGSVIPLNEETNRAIHTEFLARMRCPQAIVNHILMLRSKHSEELVRITPAQIKVPTVVIHGSEDPIFPPDHGIALSQLILDSEYIFVEGMGHVPNDHFYSLYIDVLKKQAAKTKDL